MILFVAHYTCSGLQETLSMSVPAFFETADLASVLSRREQAHTAVTIRMAMNADETGFKKFLAQLSDPDDSTLDHDSGDDESWNALASALAS